VQKVEWEHEPGRSDLHHFDIAATIKRFNEVLPSSTGSIKKPTSSPSTGADAIARSSDSLVYFDDGGSGMR
jgi:hypothetical protein